MYRSHLVWPMAGANSGVINEDVLDETTYLQELRQLLELSNSSESASLLRQHEASSLEQLHLESSKLLRAARRLSRETDTARPIFHAILDEYERWLYSSSSDFKLAAVSTQTPSMKKANVVSNHQAFPYCHPL